VKYQSTWDLVFAEISDRNFAPKCPTGQQVVQKNLQPAAAGFDPLFGLTCDDHFCSSGSTCVQQDVAAFCCAALISPNSTQQIGTRQWELDVSVMHARMIW